MMTAPKALRLHIGLFGRANTGKSSFLNMVTGQDTSIVSPVPGTTTDSVIKSMELLPLGPVTFLDTAGIDDESELGEQRIAKTFRALASSDIALLILESGIWTEYEQTIADECGRTKTPLILVINKTDIHPVQTDWSDSLAYPYMQCSASRCMRYHDEREACMLELKRLLLSACPENFLDPPAILGDLIPRTGSLPVVVMIVPIDIQAPKGRLILPQVQAIRDALDYNASVCVVRETDYPAFLGRLASPPDLVICDSQAAGLMVQNTPADIPCTTFSILFSRYKGDITAMARGAAVLTSLRPGDRILIAEACTHHALEDDIGRVKIPG
ncbi:[FeFe] hydrogenase H-cluster maturation GTPase HydF [Brucepastera parasyntrophica]|uniref:[FeFe] hydrogenase H-cluster maturation GTPase HydF n=1 Tax=Brucepastera parasyntrophica TaxID=2880008 RepID=UPI00210B89C6|nr:[FeFe] hydrogenase H-cluster maturation GTPase HydF [Brucepastera parasyntrophica]